MVQKTEKWDLLFARKIWNFAMNPQSFGKLQLTPKIGKEEDRSKNGSQIKRMNLGHKSKFNDKVEQRFFSTAKNDLKRSVIKRQIIYLSHLQLLKF